MLPTMIEAASGKGPYAAEVVYPLLFGELVASFLGTTLFAFLLFHTYLTVRGLTTIEFCEKYVFTAPRGGNRTGAAPVRAAQEAAKRRNPFDIGCCQNWTSVMGSSMLCWFFPVAGPVGDGLSFSTQPVLNGDHQDREPLIGSDGGP